MFGLHDDDLQEIKKFLKEFPEIEEAVLFGSRALGTHKHGSDVDIALKGKKVENVISRIAGHLNDESTQPYYFDVIDYHSITEPNLTDHIDRIGIVLYSKKSIDCS